MARQQAKKKSERAEVLQILREYPYTYGHAVGFDKLNPINNEWIKAFIYGHGDGEEEHTLQAHRQSYKTTSVSVALALIIILYPNETTKFFRKTDAAVKEIMAQVSKMLKHSTTRNLVRKIYGPNVNLKLTVDNALEISTNLMNDPRGTSQLCAGGIKSSITGQHYDRIFTDDIVTIEDRTSRAERELTKTKYLELKNIINDGGRIENTGTPWHKEDAFTLMPEPERWPWNKTGIISKRKIQKLREELSPSLFAANYELKHIASEDVIFTDPKTGAPQEKVLNAQVVHIDAAYGGEDFTALTIAKKTEGKYYIYGRIWQRAVDEVLPEIIREKNRLLGGCIYCETNGDKGYLAKTIREKYKDQGVKVSTYNETTNKYIKIVTHLKGDWANIVFIEGTDPEYIQQILDYNEFVEHDDAPDSAACSIRILHPRKNAEDQVSSFAI